MEQGQTSFRNDFEREFWAKVYGDHTSRGHWWQTATAEADAAVSALRRRERRTVVLDGALGTPPTLEKLCEAVSAQELVTKMVDDAGDVTPEIRIGACVTHRRTGERGVLRQVNDGIATVSRQFLAMKRVPLVELFEDESPGTCHACGAVGGRPTDTAARSKPNQERLEELEPLLGDQALRDPTVNRAFSDALLGKSGFDERELLTRIIRLLCCDLVSERTMGRAR